MDSTGESLSTAYQLYATLTAAAGGGLLVSLGVTAALVLRVRRLRAERDRAAVRAREDLARDVHDLVGHWLWLASIKSELAHRHAAGDARLRGELDEALGAIRHAAHAVRHLSRGDRELSVRGESARAEALLTGLGVECSVTVEAAALSREVSAALGIVVREGVTNMLRHSAAGRCVIELAEHEGGLRLTVANDGAPGPGRPCPGRGEGAGAGAGAGGPETPPPAGDGLGNLRHRLGGLGGTVRATSGEDGWFTLTAEVPGRFSE